MKSYVLVTFAFLGAAFYVMSGGSDFVPRKADLMAAAAAQAEADARRVAEAEAAKPQPAPQPMPQIVSADAALAVKDQATPAAVTLNTAPAPAETAATTETPPEITLVSLEQSGVLFARPLQQLQDQGATPATPGVVLAPATPEPRTDLRTVTGDRVNLRSGPGTDFDVVGSLSRGDEVEILHDDGIGWVQMRMPDGRIGWIADFLLTAPAG